MIYDTAAMGNWTFLKRHQESAKQFVQQDKKMFVTCINLSVARLFLLVLPPTDTSTQLKQVWIATSIEFWSSSQSHEMGQNHYNITIMKAIIDGEASRCQILVETECLYFYDLIKNYCSSWSRCYRKFFQNYTIHF